MTDTTGINQIYHIESRNLVSNTSNSSQNWTINISQHELYFTMIYYCPIFVLRKAMK